MSEPLPLPVTLVTGFLGAGKTTLVNHLLRSLPERRIGVLVNDFGEISIDADLVLARTEDVVSLTNGCICCSLRGALTSHVMAIAEAPARPDHLLVEASGISDPRTLLEALLELERYQIVRLDGVVAVVDASEHLRLEGEAAALARRQVQAADVVIVAKPDLAGPEELQEVVAAVGAHAGRVLVAEQAAVRPELILGLEGPFERDLERNPGRRLELASAPTAAWSTWRFSSDRPVVFKALVPVLRDLPRTVYRAKGFLHLVERPGDRLVLHLAGRRVQIRTVGRWGETPPRSELVLVGTPGSIDAGALAERFGACLEGQAEPGEPPPRAVGWSRG